MESFNFKRAGLNMKKKKPIKRVYIKKEVNNEIITKNKNINNYDTNNINNTDDINSINYSYIKNELTQQEQDLLKLYWPNYSTEKKTLAQILKDKEIYYKLNKDWFEFLYKN